MRILIYTFLVAGLIISCKSEGKKMTESGYAYEFLVDAPGASANEGDYVYFEMDILDPEGNILQSVRNLPQMPMVRIPQGENASSQANPITDVLGMASNGDSLALYIPIDSMPRPPANMEEFDQIQYNIAIREILDEEGYNARAAKEKAERDSLQMIAKARQQEVADFIGGVYASYKASSLENIMDHESGLKYIIHEKGDGPIATNGQNIKAHYYGVFVENGEMFDNSFKTGNTFGFPLGQGRVIQGWDIGFSLLPQGTKATLIVPYNLAYGEAGRGSIPAKADLMFYVEVL